MGRSFLARLTNDQRSPLRRRDRAGQPYAGLNVYAFDGTRYTGYHGVTDAEGHVTFALPQGSYRFRADFEGVQFWSDDASSCALPGCVNAAVTLPGGLVKTDVTIDYTYDGLYRLTAAEYSDGTSYQYAYDAVGNRLTQETVISGQSSASSYQYDAANRLTSVDGVSYSWDASGNLLNDGENTYTYDSANRLTMVSGPSSMVSYAYNGSGDRLSQTVNSQTTNYTLDLNAGLTQVLEDGENTYLYGNGRIAQLNTASPNTEYFLGDALGSVRQLVDSNAEVTLTKSYTPYGEVLSTSGSGESAFAYTGEATDPTGMVYLRARYYSPYLNRFITRDTWGGFANSPMSLNRWSYTNANPVNYTDPTGHFPEWCRSTWTKWGYAKCVLDYYHLEPSGSIFFNGNAVKNVRGSSRCWGGPIEYRAMGYLEGYSWFGTVVWGGEEIVYDFATMERSAFSYIGGGISDSVLGGGYALYVGLADGLRSDMSIQEHYMGLARVTSFGGDLSLEDIGLPTDIVSAGLGVVSSTSLSDKKLQTLSVYIGIGAAWVSIPYIDIGTGIVNYTPSGKYEDYGPDHLATMAADMLLGKDTPYPETVQNTFFPELMKIRSFALVNLLPYYAYVYEEMRNERIRFKE